MARARYIALPLALLSSLPRLLLFLMIDQLGLGLAELL